MLKRLKKPTMIQVNIQMTKAEKRRLVARAKRYTEGNISEWVRFSSLELEPDAKDLI